MSYSRRLVVFFLVFTRFLAGRNLLVDSRNDFIPVISTGRKNSRDFDENIVFIAVKTSHDEDIAAVRCKLILRKLSAL